MKPIEFVSTSDNDRNTNATSPWTKPAGKFEDLILKPEYEERKLRFNEGTTWFRVVPAMESSIHGWMLPVHALNYNGGRFAHPKTLKKNARSVFDHAYVWMRENHPEMLYSKTNKKGVRLLTTPMALYSVIVEEEGQNRVRFLLCSGYDGSRGGAQGLGYEIWKAARDYDEHGKLVSDAIEPTAGLRFCVEKTKPLGAKYASYALRVGRQPAPIATLIDSMAPEEVQALCPLENVIRELDDETQWKCLEHSLSPEHIEQIRASLK